MNRQWRNHMVDMLNKLKKSEHLRQDLIQLKETIKSSEAKEKQELSKALEEEREFVKELLFHEDAKVRKNMATIIGDLSIASFQEEIFAGYEQDGTLFNKTVYLKTLEQLGYDAYKEQLALRLEEIMKEDKQEENKHIVQEIRQLTKMLSKVNMLSKHRFVGYDVPSVVFLTTNRNHVSLTKEQLKFLPCKVNSSGVLVKADSIRDIMQVRTFDELLFDVTKGKLVENNPEKAASALLEGGLVKYLNERHLKGGAYPFRIELRGKQSPEEKASFVKKMAQQLEVLSNHQLVNSVSDYEIELRFMEIKSGKLYPFLKCYTLKDHRFDYRKHYLPTSLHSSTAATIIELAKPYMKQGAQILDPFCGTGTMLIERNYACRAYSSYGVDIFNDAILMARENTEKAGMVIHYINRDMRDFTHEYLFDEVITNMPVVTEKKGAEEMRQLYFDFFKKIGTLLKKHSYLFLYTKENDMMNQCLQRFPSYSLVKKYPIYEKEGSNLYIITN